MSIIILSFITGIIGGLIIGRIYFKQRTQETKRRRPLTQQEKQRIITTKIVLEGADKYIEDLQRIGKELSKLDEIRSTQFSRSED